MLPNNVLQVCCSVCRLKPNRTSGSGAQQEPLSDNEGQGWQNLPEWEPTQLLLRALCSLMRQHYCPHLHDLPTATASVVCFSVGFTCCYCLQGQHWSCIWQCTLAPTMIALLPLPAGPLLQPQPAGPTHQGHAAAA